MCNCRKELTAKLLENAKNQLPNSTGHSVEIEGFAFAITPKLGVIGRGYMPVTVTHTVKNKRTGIEKRKVEKVRLLASYCPFCGEKQSNENEPAEPAKETVCDN